MSPELKRALDAVANAQRTQTLQSATVMELVRELVGRINWRWVAFVFTLGAMLGLGLFSCVQGNRYLDDKAQIEAYLRQQSSQP